MWSEGKVVIVTGASRGIGKAISKRLSSIGMNVALVSRNKNSLKEVLKELDGDNNSIYPVDVSDFSGVKKVVDSIYEKYGRIDFLVNNAGITKDTFLLRMSEKDWDEVISINLKGVFNFTKHSLQYMVKKREGVIVNISSIVGLMGNIAQANYSASKAGIIGFTKSIAKEYGSKGVRANVIAPGFIETDMTEALPERIKEEYLKNIPLKRFGSVDDVSGVVEFLLSPSAGYITGTVINVSGGLYI